MSPVQQNMTKASFVCLALIAAASVALARHTQMEFTAVGEEDIGKVIDGKLVKKTDRATVRLALTEVEPGDKAWKADYQICRENMQHFWSGSLLLYFGGRAELVEVPMCTYSDSPRCFDQIVCKDNPKICANKSWPCITVRNRRFKWNSLSHTIGDAEFPTAAFVTQREDIVVPLKPTTPA